MPISNVQNAFVKGEISPSVWGRTDVKDYHLGAFTMRNFWVNYKGGASSRTGFAYVGTCKQPGTASPPRDIPFQFSQNQGFALEFGDQYMRVKSNGAYVIETPITLTGVSNVALFTTPGAHGFSVGDWVFDSGNVGFSGLTWVVNTVPTTTTFTVKDLFGNVISVSTASSGGTIARVYTKTTPYAAIDLPYLKFTQSANTMSLTCVNQATLTEYPPYDLLRVNNTNWTFTQATFATNIAAPTGVTSVASSSTTISTWYSYVVTAIDSVTGQESVASAPTYCENNDIAVNAGTNTISWIAVTGASSYNVYKATPSYTAQVPAGVSYGYAGTAFGNSFSDKNITADFTRVPPVHSNPFARSAITNVVMTANGTGYTQSTVGFTLTTAGGTGFAGTPVVDSSGTIVGFIIANQGQGYSNTDTIAFTGGSGATATLTIGAATGTYPAAVAYFQQRRVYANTTNNPNTYYMSQPGAFLNMDSSIPTSPQDAIIGTPWAQQINGIQFVVPMPGGLVIYTGNGAWQLNGGTQAAITPANQSATPQSQQFGCSPTVAPIPIGYNIVFLDSQGSVTRTMLYNYYFQIYTTTDQTLYSSHLFLNHQLTQWAYCDSPYKIIWATREDGILLSFTYLQEQEIAGWTRHDTNGLYIGVCKVKEPPVDALYVITKRYVNGQWMYYSERMNNRNWNTVEDAYCVDAGLQWPMTSPNTSLNASGTTGTVTFTASASVFSSGNVSNVIRMGGGKATVATFISGTQVTATIINPITNTIPNDPNNTVVTAAPGAWTITPTTNTVSGLNHLEGLTVAILADGSVVAPQVVTNGTVSLPQSYSAITIGLPYICQLQTPYLDPPGQQIIQGKRKNIYNASIRVEASRGFSVGTNQVDSSTQPNSPIQIWPKQTQTQPGMVELKERGAAVTLGSSIPLFTGDHFINVTATWAEPGQVAIQQTYPLPCNILSIVSNYDIGDTPGQ